MSVTLRLAAALPLLALGASHALAGAPNEATTDADLDANADSKRIVPGAPWARVLTGPLSKSPFERKYGAEAEAQRQAFAPFMQDGNRFDNNSGSAAMFEAMGLPPPQHANAYEPAVGVLYVAMEGVALTNVCGGGDTVNAAKNCSPLVDGPTNFPALSDNGGQQAAVFQELRGYYEPFNLVMTTARPPEFLPYTMAVIGGSAGQAGQRQGVCGVANVACDGLKRNHVSLTFPQSCNATGNTAAQETAHNWGLEHTDNTSDLMYPFTGGGFQSFVDSCMTISHATGDGETQCGYVHETYCPDGGGEVQNSYAELMGVFGPRQADSVAPQIVSIEPADGSVFSSEDTFKVTASITENSRMVGVRWTWVEGLDNLPDGPKSFTKCTNNMCDEDFSTGASFDPDAVNWDFVNFNKPPVGTYSFHFEVLDAYGNGASETITVEVKAAEGGSDAADDDNDGDAGLDESGGGNGSDASNDDRNDDRNDDGTADDGDDNSSNDDTGGSSVGADGTDDAGGGGCSVTPAKPPTVPWSGGAALLGLLVAAGGRRRT